MELLLRRGELLVAVQERPELGVVVAVGLVGDERESGKYLYSVARPMPVCSAICDIVTDRSPCSATRAAAVSMIAPRTSRRCAAMVWFHSFGTSRVYVTARVETLLIEYRHYV